MKRSISALLIAAATGAAFAAGGSGKLDSADQKFVEKAAAGGMLEVQAGQMAETKAQSPEVKSFGAMLVKDHSAANDELKTLAQNKGVTLPTTLPKHEQGELDKMSKAKNFDQEFVKENVKDHKKDIKEFEKESKDAKDPDVKAFAAKTLPTLQMHLQKAEDLEKSMGGKSMGAGKS